MKAIAFYLPQFSPNEYNDLWWGKGFTEWAYVAQGKPLFKGHYQPHVPSDLGFYDLRIKQVVKQQQEMAKQYGIYGFCYYHYYFNGKLMLHEPLNNMLENKDLDFPFCVCWANETWSKTWDGINSTTDILMKYDKENYKPEEHMEWLIKLFRDKRYIRINDRPVFFVYRPENFNNTSEVICKWKKYVYEKTGMNLYIVAADHIGNNTSNRKLINLGYDAVYEFKPNWNDLSGFEQEYSPIDTLSIYKYKDVVEYDIKKTYKNKVFPCVFPSWDNTARKTVNATVIQNNNCDLYKKWLTKSCQKMLEFPEEEQVVMINAWNEWGEGCHLEPDIENGRAFLESTRQVLAGFNEIKQDIHVYKSIDKKSYDISLKKYIRFIPKDKKVFIWGTGKAGNDLALQLQQNDVTFYGFIDNNKSKWDTNLMGLNIFGPSILKDKLGDIYVLVASMYYKEISEQLRGNKYEEYMDFSYCDKNYTAIKLDKGSMLLKLNTDDYDINNIKNNISTLSKDRLEQKQKELDISLRILDDIKSYEK